jgi:D-alanyl-D-alanine carboxypeptidase
MLVLASGGCTSHPTETEILQSQLEQLLEETGIPGIAVAVSESGGAPLVAAAGYADMAREIPVGAETPFFIGSISKNVFTTIALQLVDDGLLELHDPLSAFLEWPRGDEITIRMLLNHTSGIPDYFGSLSLSAPGGVPEFFSDPHPPTEIFRLMPSRDPTFDPGGSQAYSNTNGLLLGRIIEIATGKPLGDVFEERIASPLALDNAYLYDARTIDRPRARGYCGQPGWAPAPGELLDCSFADNALPNSADGSVVSSAPDLLRYHRALRGGELLSETSWDAMRRVDPDRVNGLNYLIMSSPLGEAEGNAGRSMGHVSGSVYYVERDLFVVMLVNRGDAALPMQQFLELRYGTD